MKLRSAMSTPETLDVSRAQSFAERVWEGENPPRARRVHPHPQQVAGASTPQWHEHGHMERAVALVEAWCRKQPIPRPHGRGPPPRGPRAAHPDGDPRATGSTDTVLLYGHLDKQPEMTGWREGLSPWEPVREGDKLYGRGGADDGYSAFASLAALRLLHEQGVPHARCVVLIEAGEESGSPDLPAYIEALDGAHRHAQPRRLPRLRLRQLRRALVDHLAPRPRRRRAPRRRAHARASTPAQRERRRAVELPHPAPAPLAHRGREDRRVLLRDAPRRHPRGAPRAGRGLGRGAAARGAATPSLFAAARARSATDLVELLLNRTWRPALAVTGADGFPATRRRRATSCAPTRR